MFNEGTPALHSSHHQGKEMCGVAFCRSFQDEDGPKQWSNLRYAYVMKLRQAALNSAREMWADYFMVDNSCKSRQVAWMHVFFFFLFYVLLLLILHAVSQFHML